jgi:hypothetical protein
MVQIGRTANIIANRRDHSYFLFQNGKNNLSTTPNVTIVVSHYLFPHKKMSIRKRSRLSPDLIIAISIVISEKVVEDNVKRNKVLERKLLDWDFHGSQLLR